MNVKISISVPIEEVELEVQKLLEDCQTRTKNLVEDLHKIILEHGNPLVQLKMIQDFRQKLTAVDIKLEDSYSILTGYIRYKTNDTHQGDQDDTDKEGESSKDSAK